jgi:hypothetical protein
MSKPKHPAGPGMTLGNMRELGVQNLIASCLNPSCLHEGLIDVSKYPADTEVPSFARKVVCAKCGVRVRAIVHSPGNALVGRIEVPCHCRRSDSFPTPSNGMLWPRTRQPRCGSLKEGRAANVLA